MLRGSRLCALAALAGGVGVARAASNTSTGSTIIYVVIGLVVLLFLVAAALVWRCYRNRARRRAERAHTFEPQAFHHQAPSMATYRMDMLHAEDVDDREAHKHRRDEATPEAVYEMHPRTPVTELGEFQDARSEDNRSGDNRSADNRSVDNRSADNRSGDARSEEDLEAATQADYPPYDDGRGHRAHSRGSDSRSTQGGRATQDSRATHGSRATHDRQARASDQVARSPFQQQDELLSHDPPPNAASEDLSATAAAKRLRKDNENAAARAQDTLARVLNEFETDPLFAGRRLPFSSLYYTRVLSKGAFGEVWLAQLESRQVAVKRILSEKKNDPKEVECFAAEIKLMATFNHPKIVEFVGISGSTLQDLCAITEYMGRGDLYNFLKRYVGKLSWRDHKIFLAEDVADALGYLHSLSPKVIHRDLKSKNILLDDVFRAKLSDFGISRERSVEDTMTAGVGTIYWTAPEVLMGKKYTEKADIYSFGIVMSELDTHQVPYSDKRDDSGKKLQGMKVVANVIRRDLRPTLSSACPPQVQALTARCVDVDPAARPDAFELLALIRQIEDELA